MLWLLPVSLFSDAQWYVDRAIDMANGLGYSEGGIPTAFWAVGWPATLSAVYQLTGSMPATIALLNLCAAAVTLSVIGWLGSRLFDDKRIAALAVLAYAVYPSHIAYTSVAMNETVYNALFCLAVALTIVGKHRNVALIAAGLLFGLATLVKAQTYLFPIGLVVALFMVYRSVDWKRALSMAVVVYISLFAIVLPWSMRNYYTMGEFILVSSNGGSVMYYSANPNADGQYIDLVDLYPEVGLDWEKRISHQVEYDKVFRAAAVKWVKENPEKYLALMPRKFFMIWAKDADGFWHLENTYPELKSAITGAKIVNQLFYFLLLLAALPAMVAGVRGLLTKDRKNAPVALLFVVPAFVSLLAMFLSGITRYHHPAMPFIALAAAWTAIHWLNKRERRLLDSPTTH